MTTSMAGRLVHDALFYDADDRFVAALAPFLRAGLARGDAAVAAVTRHNIGLLRDALGPDAAAVSFIDRDDWYARPTRTVAGWRRLLTDATGRGHPFVRIVGEVRFGRADEHAEWTRYESAINGVFADAPAWIVCPYDTRVLPAAVLADAHRTHPGLAGPGPRRQSAGYVAPGTLLREVREPGPPPVAGPPLLHLALDGTVSAARHAVATAVAAGGWLDPDRLEDLLIGVSELVGNSLRHGDGRRELRLWAAPWGIVGEVCDEGPGPGDPLVGYRPPDAAACGGRGLWLVRQLCDALSVEHRHGVTRARFGVRAAGTPR